MPSRLVGYIHSITLYPEKTAAELLELGEYNWSRDFVDTLFPVRIREYVHRNIVFVKFDTPTRISEVVAEFERIKLKRPIYEDALWFGAQKPEVQRGQIIVFPHRHVMRADGREGVLCLYGITGGRGLEVGYIGEFENDFDADCVFAGVSYSSHNLDNLT
jgi:hypothetical protein